MPESFCDGPQAGAQLFAPDLSLASPSVLSLASHNGSVSLLSNSVSFMQHGPTYKPIS